MLAKLPEPWCSDIQHLSQKYFQHVSKEIIYEKHLLKNHLSLLSLFQGISFQFIKAKKYIPPGYCQVQVKVTRPSIWPLLC